MTKKITKDIFQQEAVTASRANLRSHTDRYPPLAGAGGGIDRLTFRDVKTKDDQLGEMLKRVQHDLAGGNANLINRANNTETYVKYATLSHPELVSESHHTDSFTNNHNEMLNLFQHD